MKRKLRTAYLSVAALLSIGAAPAWNPSPWLADLKQFRSVIDSDYPNLDWLTRQREVSLDRWFARTADEIRQSSDDADARRAMDSLVERFNDGHLLLRWPAGASTPAEVGSAGTSSVEASPMTIATFCAAKGYNAGQVTPGTAFDKPCDDTCDDRVLTEAFALMTRALMSTVERLRAAGAQVLLVDLTRNGGGTEWTEAAARIISPVPLRSAPIGVIRGDAWVTRWRALATKLRHEASEAGTVDRTMLLDLAQRADATADELKPCKGKPCSRTAQAGFASGLMPELPAGRLDGKTWGPDVFSAAQFPYRDHVWKGPVIVLVDNETWSAAEQFAALLQDNSAAIVMGTRTGGAGCGHLYGNDLSVRT
jgi:hypothetical protein